jgi:uncharacterized protein
VGTVVTPQLVDVVDTLTGERNHPSGVSRRLSFCQVESWGLRMEAPTPDDPFTESEIVWLIPEAGLRLTHRRPRSRHARTGPTTLTACRTLRGSRSWHTVDLLLGLAIAEGAGGLPRIVGSEEYAAAVAGHALHPGDADLALRTVHRTFAELAHCYHDLEPWLATHRIHTPWPPL